MDAALLYKRRRSGISLTALIDVVFILLMYFMLTTSFTSEKQLELASPVASQVPLTTIPQQVLLGVAGELSVLGASADNLSDPDVTSTLTNKKSSLTALEYLKSTLDASQPVVIRPAPDADVQTVITAITQLKALGLSQLSLGKPCPESCSTGAHADAS